MKKIIILLIIIALICIAYFCRSCFSCSDVHEDRKAIVKRQRGSVYIVKGKEKIPVADGVYLHDDSLIITGGDGRAVINFKADRITLFPESVIVLDSGKKGEGKRKDARIISLRKGEAYFRSASDSEDGNIGRFKTPLAEIESGKAKFVITGNSEKVTAVVVEGSIRVNSGNGHGNAVVVVKDQKATIVKGEKAVVTQLTQKEKENLREKLNRQNRLLSKDGTKDVIKKSKITSVENTSVVRKNSSKESSSRKESITNNKKKRDKKTVVLDETIVEPVLEVPEIR